MFAKKLILLSLLAAMIPAAVVSSPTFAQCWGAKGSEVYHSDSGCAAKRRIKPANLVTFPSADAAKQNGRRLCKKC